MFRRANGFALLMVAVLVAACDSALPVKPDPAPGSDSTTTGNHPPTAVILGTTMTTEGTEADFSAHNSSDPDGDTLTYWWDFGDGSERFGADVERHLYIDNGNYVVTLIVTDPHHAADTATQALTINNCPPYLDSLSLSVATNPAASPIEARLAFRVTDRGIEDNPVANVDWGDGVVSQLKTHTYTAPGVYAIVIRVSDKDGGVDSTRVQETIWVYTPGQSGTAPNYDAVDLETIGGKQTVPAALNNLGDVVGYAMRPAGETDDLGMPLKHAFVWRNGVITDINPGSPNASAAQTINDAGWISGAAWTHSGNSMAIWRNTSLQTLTSTGWDDNRAEAVDVTALGDVLVNVAGHEYPKAYVWRDGALQGLGGLGSSQFAWAADRNSRGQIVGTSVVRFLMTQNDEDRGFVWEAGAMRELGVLGKYPCDSAGLYPSQCGYSAAVDVNEHGEIVGISRTTAATDRAVMWDAGSATPRDLGFGGGRSRAVAINTRGQIVGDSYGDGDAYFRDSDGSITSLGSLGGGHTQVVAMNNGGTVVGFSTTASGDVRAFVWQPGLGMRDLGAGPFGAPGVGSMPVAINDRGDIIGMAMPCQHPWNGTCFPSYLGAVRGVLWRALAPDAAAAR